VTVSELREILLKYPPELEVRYCAFQRLHELTPYLVFLDKEDGKTVVGIGA
jgi:hypothetical protein